MPGTLMPPIPVDRELVPETRLPIPAGLARSRQILVRGVPFAWPLDLELGLVLIVPAGDAVRWRDADPTAIVADSDLDDAPNLPGDPESPRRAPARLLVRRGRDVLAAVPLVAGLWRVLPDGDADQSIVELYIVGFRMAAGTLRGAGDYGSFVEVAWRRVGRGTPSFTPPPIDRRVAERVGEPAPSASDAPAAIVARRGGFAPIALPVDPNRAAARRQRRRLATDLLRGVAKTARLASRAFRAAVPITTRRSRRRCPAVSMVAATRRHRGHDE